MKSSTLDSKITAEHLERMAYVYIRQSSPRQVEQHQQSGRRQYELAGWVQQLGWSKERIVVVDEDQGQSGCIAKARAGFGNMVRAVGRSEVGIVISTEVSRLARNSPDWSNLMYLSRYTATLISDGEKIYDPALSDDRMVLGIRGQVSELEMDISIQRMVAARWHQAKLGEAVSIPPAGYEIDELGALVTTNDEAVSEAIRMVFEKFDELGCAMHVYLYWKESGRKFPVRRRQLRSHPVVWMKPTYHALLAVLHNPIYAGAYAYGRTQTVRQVDYEGVARVRVRRVQRRKWPVLIQDHHPAYITYEKYVLNQGRLRGNMPKGQQDDVNEKGPVREGDSLLQGLVRCGQCGRSMSVAYSGRPSQSRRYHYYICAGGHEALGGNGCQNVNGLRLDRAVEEAFVNAIEPAGREAAEIAEAELRGELDRSKRYWELQVERAEYEAQRAQRQYDAVEPENRVVARELERRWNERLEELSRLREQAQRFVEQKRPLTEAEGERVRRLGEEVGEVWSASTTTRQDQKRLVRCLIEEVQVRTQAEQHLVRIIWKGGATTELEARHVKRGQAHVAGEEIVELVRRLALEFNDAQIARILTRQGIRNMGGRSYTRSGVCSLRNCHGITSSPRPVAKDPREGPFTAEEAATELGVAYGTIHRWLSEGVLRGGQVAPGAPWRIVLTEEVRTRLTAGGVPAGWVSLTEAAKRLGRPKATVAHWVNTGKLNAVRTMLGKRSCWRIDVSSVDCGLQSDLFDQMITKCQREA